MSAGEAAPSRLTIAPFDFNPGYIAMVEASLKQTAGSATAARILDHIVKMQEHILALEKPI